MESLSMDTCSDDESGRNYLYTYMYIHIYIPPPPPISWIQIKSKPPQRCPLQRHSVLSTVVSSHTDVPYTVSFHDLYSCVTVSAHVLLVGRALTSLAIYLRMILPFPGTCHIKHLLLGCSCPSGHVTTCCRDPGGILLALLCRCALMSPAHWTHNRDGTVYIYPFFSHKWTK